MKKENNNSVRKFARYKENLSVKTIEGIDYIYSYDTRVAVIRHDLKQVIIYGWYSMTTSKHINYVAKEFGYDVVKSIFY